jgi:hypothetical protein
MRLSAERLARMTLARQFPAIPGRGRTAVLDLFDRLGPIQSQVPRAPFLTAASRLPGVAYQTLQSAFTDFELLRVTNLRGTVHTCRPAIFGAADAVSRQARAVQQRRVLGLAEAGLPVEDLVAEIEDFCTGSWRPRAELSDHILCWLGKRGARVRPGSSSSYATNLIWAHSGLLRRPRDDHWERRTDAFHRTAVEVAGPDLAALPPDRAMVHIVRTHLASYGPASRQDIAWWSGSALTPLDRALSIMDAELVHHTGPDGEDLLDLAELPGNGFRDPGLRLLPEFDGLLLGYAPAGRGRFLDPVELSRIWTRSNGMFAPMVLLDGRIAGGWRTVPGHPSTDTVIEVLPFTGGTAITEDRLAEPVRDVCRALQLTATDVRVLPAQ